jgi:hypothetical protein
MAIQASPGTISPQSKYAMNLWCLDIINSKVIITVVSHACRQSLPSCVCLSRPITDRAAKKSAMDSIVHSQMHKPLFQRIYSLSISKMSNMSSCRSVLISQYHSLVPSFVRGSHRRTSLQHEKCMYTAIPRWNMLDYQSFIFASCGCQYYMLIIPPPCIMHTTSFQPVSNDQWRKQWRFFDSVRFASKPFFRFDSSLQPNGRKCWRRHMLAHVPRTTAREMSPKATNCAREVPPPKDSAGDMFHARHTKQYYVAERVILVLTIIFALPC